MCTCIFILVWYAFIWNIYMQRCIHMYAYITCIYINYVHTYCIFSSSLFQAPPLPLSFGPAPCAELRWVSPSLSLDCLSRFLPFALFLLFPFSLSLSLSLSLTQLHLAQNLKGSFSLSLSLHVCVCTYIISHTQACERAHSHTLTLAMHLEAWRR